MGISGEITLKGVSVQQNQPHVPQGGKSPKRATVMCVNLHDFPKSGQ